jgi:cytochrome b pre-mRNA-processing protein 3
VPKKVKRAAQALGERCLAYRAAVNAAEPVAALADEIASTVPGLEHNSESRRRLARFALAAHAALRERAGDDLRLGRLSFPAPVERSETIR